MMKEPAMPDFDNYTNGYGKIKSPNENARNLIVHKLQNQGLRRTFKIPLEKMSYILYEENDSDFLPPKIAYMIQWRGNISA
jgi:hypothetical protein